MSDEWIEGHCCSCGRDETPVMAFKAGAGTSEREHTHCDFCWNNDAGSACQAPGAYPVTQTSLARAAWWLLERMKNVPNQG